jgi:hypothetical protein
MVRTNYDFNPFLQIVINYVGYFNREVGFFYTTKEEKINRPKSTIKFPFMY